jgi:hypothetical protein
MTRDRGKFLLFSFALVSAAFVTATLARQSPVPTSPALDPLLGKWNLNVDKSKNAPVGEVITITSKESGFVLEFDVKNGNDYNPKYSMTTDMKGTPVQPVYADGSKADAQWRVTRRSPNKFDMELFTHFGGWTDGYEVVSHGKSMTMHRHTTPGGRIVAAPLTEHIFAFEKVK